MAAHEDDEIADAVERATDSNTFTDADHTKLNAIEASADVTDAANVTAAGALMKTGGTMSGAIAMGSQNITGGGAITGTTLTGTSLDINGAADISGNITNAGWTGDVIASAYLDSDTAHLSTTQTFTGAKTFSNTANHYNGHFHWDAYDAAGNHYPHIKDGSSNGGSTVNWRQYYGTSYKNHTWVSDASGNMTQTFQGDITAVGALTGTSLDINGNGGYIWYYKSRRRRH